MHEHQGLRSTDWRMPSAKPCSLSICTIYPDAHISLMCPLGFFFLFLFLALLLTPPTHPSEIPKCRPPKDRDNVDCIHCLTLRSYHSVWNILLSKCLLREQTRNKRKYNTTLASNYFIIYFERQKLRNYCDRKLREQFK